MNTLGMFARRPEPGQTKTRLAAGIGDQAAAQLYASFVEDLLERCSGLSDRFIVAATPTDEATTQWFRSRMPSESELLFQPDVDFGRRIEWFFESALQQDGDQAVLIGSDSPDLPTPIIEDAFEQLQHNDVVISPATDGGYVLIGLSSRPADIFRDIRFSSPWTLLDTLQAAEVDQRKVTLLSSWYDIDTIENLGTLLALQDRNETPAAPCPRTAAELGESLNR